MLHADLCKAKTYGFGETWFAKNSIKKSLGN